MAMQQTLSPQMQQSLHLLQAPVLELKSLIQQEMQSNPTLEEPQAEEKDKDDEWDHEVQEMLDHDEEWRNYFSQSQSPRYSTAAAQERRQFLFDSQVEQESLSDHLIGQLIFSTNSEDELRVGEEIIGNLDDAGFLHVPLNEIAIAARVPVELAEKTLSLIQTFHPQGIAARDLRETLLIQLKHRGKENEIEWKLVDQSLNDLGRKRYSDLAKQFSVPVERIQEAANYIATLQPRPGGTFAPDQPQHVIQPEAAIIFHEGEWIVQMNHDPLPRLRVSDTYKDLLGKASKDANLKDYLKDKIRSGKFLIKCLHQRQDTIEKILNEIVKQQKDFLRKGPAQLKPLTMNQVALSVGVHETTVSRAIANKYVKTPHGVFPMKFFFTYGYQTEQGEIMSNTSIKGSIGDLIEKEDRKNPLSDSEIVKILSDKGINVARRTVAKYRTELKILPSNLRKEH